MKIKGLPAQTVQFQFAASAMRIIAEDRSLSRQERIAEIHKHREWIKTHADLVAEFWIAQLPPMAEAGEVWK